MGDMMNAPLSFGLRRWQCAIYANIHVLIYLRIRPTLSFPCCAQRLKQVKLKRRHESIAQRILQSCIWMLGTGTQSCVYERITRKLSYRKDDGAMRF